MAIIPAPCEGNPQSVLFNRRPFLTGEFGEINPFRHQRFADQYRVRLVELENNDSGSSYRAQSHQARPLPGKVLLPEVLARMEQANYLAGQGINSRKVWPLVFITAQARPSQIAKERWPAVLLGDDMVCLEPQFGKRFRELAILATESRAPPHRHPEPCVHERNLRRPISMPGSRFNALRSAFAYSGLN